MTKTVALLTGGWSAERDVSLMKSPQVEKALIEAGYDVRVIDVTKDLSKFIADLTPKPDVVFNNLYGKGGEDGTIQSVLDVLEIPYTHSGARASALGMHKPSAKILANSVGVQTARGEVMTREESSKEERISRPYVVKPIDEGSSVGVQIMLKGDNVTALHGDGVHADDDVLVEEFIPGREIHVTVLNGKAQGVTEIIVEGRFFDYEAKYHDERTSLVTPADIPEEIALRVMSDAEKVFKVLGCSGLARCDFRYDESQQGASGIYFLEINTIPGLAEESIAFIQPKHNGMSFAQLCKHLVETASFGDNERVETDLQKITEPHAQSKNNAT